MKFLDSLLDSCQLYHPFKLEYSCLRLNVCGLQLQCSSTWRTVNYKGHEVNEDEVDDDDMMMLIMRLQKQFSSSFSLVPFGVKGILTHSFSRGM